MHNQVLRFNTFRQFYIVDPFFAPLLEDITTGLCSDYRLYDVLLFKSNQLCIPKSSLRLKIIEELRDDRCTGRNKTLAVIVNTYFFAYNEAYCLSLC